MSVSPVKKASPMITSTTNKRKANPKKYTRTKILKENLDGDLSGISPIKSPTDKRTAAKPSTITAAITATKRRVNFGKMEGKSAKHQLAGARSKSTSNARIQELESKLRRYEAESKSHKSRIHLLNQQLKDKDKVIRNLEHKLPKVLADVSRGLYGQEGGGRGGGVGGGKKGSWKETRDAMQRNHILNIRIKELEKQCGGQTEELTHLHAENARLRDEIRMRERHSRQKNVELDKAQVRGDTLEEELENLRDKLVYTHQHSQKSLHRLQTEIDYLFGEIRMQYDNLLETEEDLKNIEDFVHSLVERNPQLQSKYPKEKADSKEAAETAYDAAETADEIAVTASEAVSDTEAAPLDKADEEKLVEIETVQSSMPARRKRWIMGNHTWPPFIKRQVLEDSRNSEQGEGEQSSDSIADDKSSAADQNAVNNVSAENSHCDNEHASEKTSDWSSSEEFENSHEKSAFCTRLEDLDFKLEVLLNKLNSTAQKHDTTNNQSFF